MKTSIHRYLTVNGTCREAMLFYKKCLGGELEFQTIGESPMAAKMPTGDQHRKSEAASIERQPHFYDTLMNSN